MIHHADALTLLPTLPRHAVDCVITSPPFQTLPTTNPLGAQTYLHDFALLGQGLHHVLSPLGTCWIVLGGLPGHPWAILHQFAATGWTVTAASTHTDCVVASLSPRHAATHSQGCPPDPYAHILTDRPYAPLSRRFVRHCLSTSTRLGHQVLDPCCGSGTVGIMALSRGRQFVGIDRDASQVALARGRCNRYQKVTTDTTDTQNTNESGDVTDVTV